MREEVGDLGCFLSPPVVRTVSVDVKQRRRLISFLLTAKRHPSFQPAGKRPFRTEYDPNSKHWFTTSFLPACRKATLGGLSMTQTPSTGLRHPSFQPAGKRPFRTEYDPNSKHCFTTSFLPACRKATLGGLSMIQTLVYDILPACRKATLGLSMTQTQSTGLRHPFRLPKSDPWTEYDPHPDIRECCIQFTDRKCSISGPYQSGCNTAPSVETPVEPLASTTSEIGRPVTEGAPGTDNYQQCTISESPRLARSHGT